MQAIELMTLGLTPTLGLIGAIILILLNVAISPLLLLLLLSLSLCVVSSPLSDEPISWESNEAPMTHYISGH